MQKYLVAACVLLFSLVGLSDNLIIAVNRKDAIQSEITAAEELQTFLEKATGLKTEIRDEDEPGPKPDFYVGRTAFARRHAPDPRMFGKEEWYVKSWDNAILVTGGRPRGVIYGVYEYLEKELGIQFIACDRTVVPRYSFHVPENMLLWDKPYMEFRSIQWGGPGPAHGDYRAFLSRTRNNHYTAPRYGGAWHFGSPSWCHTFHAYSRDFPKDKPEYFSFSGGERLRSTSDAGPGQLCTSHPEVRELVWKKLLWFIDADRKKHPDNPPDIYILAPNDNNMYCRCPRCTQFIKDHGNVSDLYIDFVNDIAARLKKVHPELRLMTLAYTYTLPPPQTIRPLDNVIIQFCNLGKEFNFGRSETLYPILSPRNDDIRGIFDKWRDLSSCLYVWDYWILYGHVQYPCFNTERFCSDLHYFARSKVRGYLAETQYQRSPFYAFRGWLAGRLALNPFQDREQLVDVFFKAYYGPAANKVREYLRLVEESVNHEEKSIALTTASQIGYLTPEFLDHADQSLQEAEKLCAEKAWNRENVRLERIIVDITRLKLKRYRSDDEKVRCASRLEANLDVLADRYAYHAVPRYRRELKNVKMLAQSFQKNVALPESFKGRNAVDLLWFDLPQRGGKHILYTEDAAACGGRAVRMGGEHRLPFIAGIYDGNKGRRGPELSMTDFPLDEKYHFYKLGTYDIQNKVAVHALPSSDFWLSLDKVAGMGRENMREVYVSFKFTGPIYVRNSKQENAVWVDRILLVRPENGKKQH